MGKSVDENVNNIEQNVTDNKTMSTGQLPSVKQVLIMIAVLIICGVGFVALSGLEDGRLVKVEDITVKDNSGVVFYIPEANMGDLITFDGCYAGIMGEPVNLWDLSVVLVPQGEDYGFMIPTYIQYSSEAGVVFDATNEYYTRTGFAANVKRDKLDLDNTSYQVMLYYNHNDRDMYVDTELVLDSSGLFDAGDVR